MITTLTGTNNFMLQSELKRRVSEFVKMHNDMALERIDCDEVELDQITGSLQSLPFLSQKKLVVLRSPGTHKKFTEEMERIFESIPETNDVIIFEPKPDKRSVYYKNLKKLTDFKEFNALDSSQLARWLVGEAKNRGGDMTAADAGYLIERVGDNQQLLSNELDKLLSYNLKISRANIDLLTEPAPQGSVFQLLDAAFEGNKRRTLELYKSQRAQQVDPLAILAMLAWQLHVLAVVKTAGERSQAEIAKEAGISPFVVQKTSRFAGKLSLSDVKRMVNELHELDVKLKSTSIDADEALKFYLLNLTIS